MCSEVGLAYDQHVGMEFRNDAWALELNPKGTVPFVKDGPLVLNESNTIVSYIANKYGAGTGERPACLPGLPAACLPSPASQSVV
jgi:glutathione S-transferase